MEATRTCRVGVTVAPLRKLRAVILIRNVPSILRFTVKEHDGPVESVFCIRFSEPLVLNELSYLY